LLPNILIFPSIQRIYYLIKCWYFSCKLYPILDKMNELTHEKFKYLFSELQYRILK
jgi:hypothetical protein